MATRTSWMLSATLGCGTLAVATKQEDEHERFPEENCAMWGAAIVSALSKMLTTRPTGEFRVSHVPTATKICHEPKEVGLRGFGVLKEHCHDLLVRTIFTCGDAEYLSAAKNAEKMLFDALFAQAKTNIRAAISAVYGNDPEGALKHLEAALREMEP